MADNRLSLEDILNEYQTDPNDDSTSKVGRSDAQKIINSTLPDPVKEPVKNEEYEEEENSSRVAVSPMSHEKNELFDGKDGTLIPANELMRQEISKKKIAVVSAEGLSDMKTGKFAIPTAEPISVTDETPKIRRMADSTRAKEERSGKNKKKRFARAEKQAYEKVSPEGEYMYTPPEFKKKKRTRSEILSDAEGYEVKKFLTDIVPSPEAEKAARPVKAAPRAETTSIDLSSKQDVEAGSLDVHVPQNAEEYARIQSKSKRTKRIVDFNYYGDVQDVGRDIYELKNILSTRVTVLALTAFLSLYMTICSRFDFPIADMFSLKNVRSYLVIQLLLGLLSLFYSAPVITKGIKNLVKLRADGDSMTAITAVTCTVSLIIAFLRTDMARDEIIHIYMPVGILALLFNAIGKMLIIRRAKRNFNFVSKNFDRHGVCYVKDEERAERLTRGTLGDFPILAAMRPADFLTDFLKYSYSADITDSFSRKAAPICLVVSFITSIFLTFFRIGTLASMDAVVFGFSIFSMLICASSCIALPFAANVPLERISKETFKNKGILLGYQSVDDLYDTNSVLATAENLFPAGTVKLGGIKVFSNTKLEEAFLDAASLTYHGGSLMQQLFTDVIDGKEELLYPIENYSYEENMGLCGWINNRRVLLGSRELMANHNIEGLPTKSQETEYSQGRIPVYLSISGNLAAMFVIDLAADRRTKKWTDKLTKKKICIIVKSVDPFITAEKIASVYGVQADMIKVLPQKLHEDFDAETKKQDRISASMACTGKFSSMAQLILGIKTIHASATTALIFQAASILLGFGLSMMLILSKAFEMNYAYMSATAMVIYNLICTSVTCFAASAKKL